MQLWRLANSKSTEEASNLETQGKVNASILNPKAIRRGISSSLGDLSLFS